MRQILFDNNQILDLKSLIKDKLFVVTGNKSFIKSGLKIFLGKLIYE